MERYFFVDNGIYNIGDYISITGDEHRHLSLVLRLPIGETIVCLPNDNRELLCKILSITKVETKVEILEIKRSIRNPNHDVTLFVGALKGDKFEFLITKLTELGVTSIIPFDSEFTVCKLTDSKDSRWTKIARDACKQCRRSKIINIGKPIKFNELLASISSFDATVFAYENETGKSLKNVINPNMNKVAIIIGSEGGFSEKEANAIKKVGAVSVGLGNRILRAETAVLATTSIVMYELNELGNL